MPRGKARQGAAEVGIVKGGIFIHCAGEGPLAQRAGVTKRGQATLLQSRLPPIPLPKTIAPYIYGIKSSFFSQFATSLSALPTVLPFIAKPAITLAVGQSFLISRSLLPRPLSSWVQ